MKAPDTIYIAPNHESIIYGRGWFELRHADTDTAYVRADLPYELSKTVEAQKAEIDRLASDCNSLSLVNQELKGEIARIQKALQFYADIGNHRGNTRTGYVPIVDAHNLGDIARAAPAVCNFPEKPLKTRAENLRLRYPAAIGVEQMNEFRAALHRIVENYNDWAGAYGPQDSAQAALALGRAIDAATALLSSPEISQQWQPIECTPEGIDLLLLAKYKQGDESHICIGDFVGNRFYDSSGSFLPFVTAWHPLPSLPVENHIEKHGPCH